MSILLAIELDIDSDTAIEIEDMYMDGISPKIIAQELDLPLEKVLAWLEAVDYIDQN